MAKFFRCRILVVEADDFRGSGVGRRFLVGTRLYLLNSSFRPAERPVPADGGPIVKIDDPESPGLTSSDPIGVAGPGRGPRYEDCVRVSSNPYTSFRFIIAHQAGRGVWP